MKSENSCYHLVQNLLSSCFLSVSIKNCNASFCFARVQNLVMQIKERPQVKSVWEKDAFEDNWPKLEK